MLKSCGCDAMTGAGGSFLGRGINDADVQARQAVEGFGERRERVFTRVGSAIDNIKGRQRPQC